MQLEYDLAKDAINRSKHGISFKRIISLRKANKREYRDYAKA